MWTFFLHHTLIPCCAYISSCVAIRDLEYVLENWICCCNIFNFLFWLQVDICNMLLEAMEDRVDINIDKTDTIGRSSIHYAACCGATICCLLLVNKGKHIVWYWYIAFSASFAYSVIYNLKIFAFEACIQGGAYCFFILKNSFRYIFTNQYTTGNFIWLY